MCGLSGAIVVAVVDMLDDCFAGPKTIVVGHVVEEEQEVVGRGGGSLIDLRDFWRILAHVAGAGGDGAVHTHTLMIGAVPLAPAVVLAGFDVGAVMAAGDVGEGLHAEGTGVGLVGGPRLHEHFRHNTIDHGIGADCLERPLMGDVGRGKIRVPREAAEGVEVGQRQG